MDFKKIKNKIMDRVLSEIKDEIAKYGYFCDSDNVEDGKEALCLKEIEELDLTTEQFNLLDKQINDEVADYLNNNYKTVSEVASSGDVEFYYFDRKYNFKNIKDLENYFNIGE